ncbi:MAG: uroporphyrinogen decarboxylase family protein [Oscillospiraceae bacterium]
MLETNYRKLHEDVCFKRSGGNIIWQPRIDCWISDRLFDFGELPGIYKGMSKAEIYRELGCSARVYEYNDCFKPVYHDTIICSTHKNGRLTEYKMETPVGTVTRILQSTPTSWAELVKKEWVETEEDLKIFTYIETHTDWAWDQNHFDKTQAEWGNLGAPTVFIPRVSMQRLYIDLMGVENAVYAIADYQEIVEEYFDALRDCHFRLIDLINTSPIEIINFGDNIHSGTLSPSLFEEYVLEEYKLRTDRLHKAGKFTCSHFDGNNQGLMEFYQQTGLDGIEAITPIPQGDVTLEEAKENLGDMIMIDGIPAVYFDETYPVEVLVECVHKIINLFAPNLILGISDEISSTGDIERIRLVGKIVDEYNAKLS